jgi:hypothetical protein
MVSESPMRPEAYHLATYNEARDLTQRLRVRACTDLRAGCDVVRESAFPR